jgi:hypothetical protein
VLDCAARSGWTPIATPADRARGPSYARPAGLEVCAEDATNLARSLSAVLPKIQDEPLALGGHAFGEKHTEDLLARRARGEDLRDEDVRAALELMSGPPKRDAERLARFLAGGAFTVDRA